MKLVVGFLTYNNASAQYLADFLPSLKEALYFLNPNEYKVLAFDNSDKRYQLNKQKIADFNLKHPGFINQLEDNNNLGFARAYNILINLAVTYRADYFLVINPDTVLDKQAIFNLYQILDSNKSLGSACPKIRRWDFAANLKTKIIDSAGLIVKPGLRFRDLGQGEIDSKQYDKNEIIGPSGAAGLFRLSSLQKVSNNGQYFDERFFMYKEDCDLAYRLYRVNESSILVADALIYHDRTAIKKKGDLSQRLIGKSYKSKQIRAWSFVNQHLLFVKHWSKEKFFSKALIICQVLIFFVFSLLLEQFNLKEYKKIKIFWKENSY